MSTLRTTGCAIALLVLALATFAHAGAPRPMGASLDSEMGALVHKEKARQQLIQRDNPNGLLGNAEDGCGNISINSNTQPQRGLIGQPPGKQNVTVINGPVINAANCR